MRVADVGGEEFKEAHRGALTGGGDKRRHGRDAGLGPERWQPEPEASQPHHAFAWCMARVNA
jgi:hypothetical protein